MSTPTRPALSADHRIHYGPSQYQFGDLWLPAPASTATTTPTTAPAQHFPLVVFIHGGWWQSAYGLDYAGPLCAALKASGIAIWSIEYRRVGSTGGGWPTTFQDVAAGFDYVATLASTYPLDLNRIIAMGHSSGAQLAFWLAGRHHIPPTSKIYEPQPKLALHGLIALAGAVDLQLVCDLSGYFTFAHDKREVYNLMGGSPAQFEVRYRAGNPGALLPLSVPQILIQSADDGQIPPQLPAMWADMARRQGDDVTVTIVPGVDHFDVVDPQSKAWASVLAAVQKLLHMGTQ
jgi:acetyl esterase/lipase